MKIIFQGLRSTLLVTQGFGTSGEPEPEPETVCLTPGRGAEERTGSREAPELTGGREPCS